MRMTRQISGSPIPCPRGRVVAIQMRARFSFEVHLSSPTSGFFTLFALQAKSWAMQLRSSNLKSIRAWTMALVIAVTGILLGFCPSRARPRSRRRRTRDRPPDGVLPKGGRVQRDHARALRRHSLLAPGGTKGFGRGTARRPGALETAPVAPRPARRVRRLRAPESRGVGRRGQGPRGQKPFCASKSATRFWTPPSTSRSATANIAAELGFAPGVAKGVAEAGESVLALAKWGGAHVFCHVFDAIILFSTRPLQTAWRTVSWAPSVGSSRFATFARLGLVSAAVNRAERRVEFVKGPVTLDAEELAEVDAQGQNRWWGWVPTGKRARWVRKLDLAGKATLDGRAYRGRGMKRYAYLLRRRRGHADHLKGDGPMDDATNHNIVWAFAVQENIVQPAFRASEQPTAPELDSLVAKAHAGLRRRARRHRSALRPRQRPAHRTDERNLARSRSGVQSRGVPAACATSRPKRSRRSCRASCAKTF